MGKLEEGEKTPEMTMDIDDYENDDSTHH